VTHSTAFFQNLGFSFLAAVAWMFLAYLTSRVVKRHAIIDVFWGAGFVVVFLESLFASYAWSSRAMTPWFHAGGMIRYLAFAVVALWGLRLSIFLGVRQRGQGEDSRYLYIMRGARGRNEVMYALLKIYLLQATLLWIVSMPVQFIAFASRLSSPLVVVGAVVVLIGVAFEGIGDAQLRRFILNPANTGKTMNKGLWAWTRHPNYFGDAVVWWGVFVMVLAVHVGWATVFSPLAMSYLLTKVSGKPMLERKLGKTREGYAEYIATTSAFIPRPPKKR